MSDIPFDDTITPGAVLLNQATVNAIEGMEQIKAVLEECKNGIDPVEHAKILGDVMPVCVNVARTAIEMAERQQRQDEARERQAQAQSTDVTQRQPAPSPAQVESNEQSIPTRLEDGDSKARNSALIRAVNPAKGDYSLVNEIMEAAGCQKSGGLQYGSLWRKVVIEAQNRGFDVDWSAG